MFDNALIAKVIELILAGEAAVGLTDTPVKQAFQPQQQGANTVPTCYLHKLFDKRIGSPRQDSKWDRDEEEMVQTYVQQYETTFQISTLATQNPATPEKYTASDILNLVAAILQRLETIALFEATEPYPIGILRIEQVRNTPFGDDRERHEFSPSLDFVLTHKQVIIGTAPVVETAEFQVLTV